MFQANLPPVKLSPEIEKALATELQMNPKDLAFIVVLDKDGETRLLHFNSVKSKRIELPITEVKAITRIKPITVLSYEGSRCLIWVEPYSEGGMAYEGFWEEK